MKHLTKTRKLLVIAGTVALIGAADVGVSLAANNAVANTSGIVVIPLSIAKVLDLNFGKFVAGGSPGTVVVDTANAQSVTGGVTTTAGLGTTAKAATFTVTGQADSTYAITYPATLPLTGPGADMAIGTFTNAVSDGSVAAGIGTLPAAGTHTLSVGATLSVAADQVAGSYSGSFDVTVNYN